MWSYFYVGNTGTCSFPPVITSSLFFLRFPIPNEWNQSEEKRGLGTPAEEKREDSPVLPTQKNKNRICLKKAKQEKKHVSFLLNNKAINNIARSMVKIQLKRHQYQQQHFPSPQKKKIKEGRREIKSLVFLDPSLRLIALVHHHMTVEGRGTKSK